MTGSEAVRRAAAAAPAASGRVWRCRPRAVAALDGRGRGLAGCDSSRRGGEERARAFGPPAVASSPPLLPGAIGREPHASAV